MYNSWVQPTQSTAALARFGHALADPTRTRALLRLSDGPAYPSDLAEELGVSRQALSNHLACLRGCGLVVAVPEGRRSRYELADPAIGRALRALVDVILVVDPACTHSDGTVDRETPTADHGAIR